MRGRIRHKLCVRCQGIAGFWVRSIDGTARRPWCLKCITAHLNPAAVRVTRFSDGQQPDTVR